MILPRLNLKNIALRTCTTVALTSTLLLQGSRGAVVFNALEVGDEVVITSTGGSIDLSGSTLHDSGEFQPSSQLRPSNGRLANGSGGMAVWDVTVISSQSFGPGGFSATSVEQGGPIGFQPSGTNPTRAVILVPQGYVSDAILGDTSSTYTTSTFASLGLVPGTYVTEFATSTGTDSITLNVGPFAASVPEPGAALPLMACLLGFGFLRRRIRSAC